jgi:hypothetical protein
MGPRTIREATADDAPVALPTMAERIEAMAKRAIAAGALTITLIYETREGLAIDAEPNTEALRKGMVEVTWAKLWPERDPPE